MRSVLSRDIKSAQSEQLRKIGDPFIINHIVLAAILADLPMDTDRTIACILQYNVENTAVILEELEKLLSTDVRRSQSALNREKNALGS